jgi:type IV pilus assembly protein PilA
MKKLLSLYHRNQRGFTLIELLIVIAILGIIAAIVVPNVAGFMTSGTLNAANTEAQNVKTAAVGFLAEEGNWPSTSGDLDEFLEGGSDALRATYIFSSAEGEGGRISDATTAEDGDWTGIDWDPTSQTWVRVEAGG